MAMSHVILMKYALIVKTTHTRTIERSFNVMLRIRGVSVLAVLLLSLAAFANPVITSISPTEGPTAGGTAVTIHG